MGGILIMGYYAKRFFKHDSEVLSGPVLWYKYENATSTNRAIYDESGNGNTGVYTGIKPGGITNNYLWLRSFGNQYVKVAPSPTLYFGDGPFTFSSKINVTKINTYQILFSKIFSTSNQFFCGFNNGKFFLQLTDALLGGTIRFITNNIVLTINTTTVATVTYSGGNNGICKMYINGVEIEEKSITISGKYQQMRDTGLSLYIGNIQSLLNNSLTIFSGTIDNSMMWNRVLTQEEILNLNNI